MEQEVKQDYFKVGSRGDIVLSNSALKKLDPEQGGHPQKFLKFFDYEEQEEEVYQRIGTIIHKYLENKEEFVIADFNAPTEMMKEWVDRVYGEFSITMDLDAAIINQKKEAYATLKDPEKILANFKKDLSYFNYLCLDKKDKILLSKAQKEVVEGAIIAINKHPKLQELLALEGENEKEIYVVFSYDSASVKGKCKIDRICFDHEKRILYKIDYKSTSKSVYNFSPTCEKFGYYTQVGFYNAALKDVMDKQYPDYKLCNVIVAIGTEKDIKNEINISCYVLSKEHEATGFINISKLVSRYFYHQVNNKWEHTLEEYINDGFNTLRINQKDIDNELIILEYAKLSSGEVLESSPSKGA